MVGPMESIHKKLGFFEEVRFSVEAVAVEVAAIVVGATKWTETL